MNDETQAPNAEQAKLWNGTGGRAWVESQAVLDRMFQPFERLLAEAIDPAARARVLDIGCGTGATTLAAARRLSGDGDAVGLDISAPMIDLARRRAADEGVAATFIVADAQTHGFEPGRFDVIQSRFGVMFFADPVGAFANLRRAAAPGAAMRLIAWRSPAENPFMTAAERAAAPLLPALPPRRPGGPGQFAFAEREHVAGILQASGWSDVNVQPLDVECTLSEPDLLRYLMWLGPVGQALQGADESTRARVLETVRGAFDPFVYGEVVRFTAACWMATARHAG